jgi:hypothetical protein
VLFGEGGSNTAAVLRSGGHSTARVALCGNCDTPLSAAVWPASDNLGSCLSPIVSVSTMRKFRSAKLKPLARVVAGVGQPGVVSVSDRLGVGVEQAETPLNQAESTGSSVGMSVPDAPTPGGRACFQIIVIRERECAGEAVRVRLPTSTRVCGDCEDDELATAG